MLPDENSKRFIAVLNKKIEIGRLMNALGHITAGLSGGSSKTEEMCFLQYQDKDGGAHPNISHFPFIVLKADNSNKIRTVRNECIARGIPFSDFTSTMTVGTSQEQQYNTWTTPEILKATPYTRNMQATFNLGLIKVVQISRLNKL